MSHEAIDASPSTPTGERIEQLVHALRAEQEILEELRDTLAGQREAVARNEQDAVEASIHAMGRIILTLEEARRQRRSVLSLLVPDHEIALVDLERYLGDALPVSLVEARAAVRTLGVATANDLAINQHVLDRVLQAGDAFLQALFSSALDASPAYTPSQDGDERSTEAMLVNRTV